MADGVNVKVKFFASLREKLGTKEVDIRLSDGCTVRTLLKHLTEKFGRPFKEYVFNEKGEIKEYILILVNGLSVHQLKGLDTELKSGDSVAILPPVSGG